jgi:type II secretory pathway predicted ATPase ExeA
MYYKYWNLTKPPFDNVPDPSMYADCHTSMENAINETLFAIEEGGESVAVIVGDMGLGKTLTLRVVMDSLDPDKYKLVLITNPGVSFLQLLREIIGRLTGKHCTETKKIDLLEIFNRILFDTADKGRKIIVFIDEANAITTANLESIRLLTNMQDDRRNLFTVVLAGQLELARRLEHPTRANLFQRIGIYSKIEKIESVEAVRSYIETRLTYAGGTGRIFTDDAIAALWQHSDHGVPRLINKLAKLSLKAGETQELREVHGPLVNGIAERFQKVTRPGGDDRHVHAADTEASPARIESKDPAAMKPSAVIPLRKVETPGRTAPAMGTTPGRRDEGISNDHEPESAHCHATRAVEGTPVKEGTRPDEIQIGDAKVKVDLPLHVLRQVQSCTKEECIRLAGILAAQTLRKNPHLTASHMSDPVTVWGRIREFVMNRFGKEAAVSAVKAM